MDAHRLVHLEGEQREGGAEAVAQDAVGRDGRRRVLGLVDLDEVRDGGDEDGDAAPAERHAAQHGHDPVHASHRGPREPEQPDGEHHAAGHRGVQPVLGGRRTPGPHHRPLVQRGVEDAEARDSEHEAYEDAEEGEPDLLLVEAVDRDEHVVVGAEEGEHHREREPGVYTQVGDEGLHEHHVYRSQESVTQFAEEDLGTAWMRWFLAPFLQSLVQDAEGGRLGHE